MTQTFSPPKWLSNAHIQNILSSSYIRKAVIKRRHPAFFNSSKELILTTPKGVRLCGKLNQHEVNTGVNRGSVAILLHGWEGSADSAYLTSMATHLYQQGHDVFRLNFRDHGDSHHLNKGIFNSTLLQEVIDAISEFQQQHSYNDYLLTGFSLGGNFALRVAAHVNQLPKPLSACAAICPVINPATTMTAFSQAPAFYERYFVKKWKRSLAKKLIHFPEYNYGPALTRTPNLDALNHYFIPLYTEFDDVESYFKGYTLTKELITTISIPTSVIASKDDPIIPIAELQNTLTDSQIQLSISNTGSHCAFIEDISLQSWADKFVGNLFQKHLYK